MTLKLCPLKEYIRNIFGKEGTFLSKNHAENVNRKLLPEPFLILVDNPKQSLHARNSFKNKIF